MDSNKLEHLIGISAPTLRVLRDAAARNPAGGEAIDTLRESGYAGGGAVFDAFVSWLRDERDRPLDTLTLREFSALAGEFFESSGWGALSLGSVKDAVAVVAIERCWESESVSPQETPSCHVTTGSLAGFFERIADYPVAVFEQACRSAGAGRCEFVLGNADMVEHAFDSFVESGTLEEIA